MNETRVAMIRDRLQQPLSTVSLEIQDDSQQHIGHTSAKGGGHFTVRVVSDDFQGKTLLQRHRMVYDALGDAMDSEIHALSIKALTVEESKAAAS